MPDYNNSKIYKLFSYENDLVYIGSTTQKLCERLRKHKQDNRTSSKILFQNSSNVKIELIEKFSCECKEELIKRERYFIRQIDCVNKRIEGRTKKEYYDENKNEVLEQKKEYYDENRAQILEKKKEYYEENKEQLKEHNKEYYKKYREEHKEENKKYREENKERIKERKAKLYTCECGKTITIGGKAKHEQTKFHIKYCQEK